MSDNVICYNSTVPSSPPRNVLANSNNETSLNVSWQPPLEMDHNGLITGYMINYTIDGSDNDMFVNVTNKTTHIISGLVTFAEYSVGVAAVNVNGTGPFSDAAVGKPGGDGEFCTWKYKPMYCYGDSSIFSIPDTIISYNC